MNGTVRVGTDLVHVAHVTDAIEAFGDAYLRRVYTPSEVSTCRTSTGAAADRLAARFAAKEAALKVLRPTGGVALTDIGVEHGHDGAPTLVLSGEAAARADAVGLVDHSLSLTHDGTYAAAVLVAVLAEPCHAHPRTPNEGHTVKEANVSDHIEVIRQVLTEHGKLAVPVPEVGDNASLYAAGLTSHAVVNVMLALENEFDTEFPIELLSRSTFESIEVLATALDRVLAAQP